MVTVAFLSCRRAEAGSAKGPGSHVPGLATIAGISRSECSFITSFTRGGRYLLSLS